MENQNNGAEIVPVSMNIPARFDIAEHIMHRIVIFRSVAPADGKDLTNKSFLDAAVLSCQKQRYLVMYTAAGSTSW